jgi:chromosome segregation ATPase
MFRFMGRTFKWAAIGTLVVVGLTALVGVTRVKTAFMSVREHLRSNVDELVDSRVALRHEVKKLQREYPKRIADLRVQLTELERDQIACERDRQVAREVVTLAEADVELLRERLASVETTGAEGDFVSVEFRSELLARDQAVARASRIAETASSYRAQLEDLNAESEMLAAERSRLKAALAQTESEYRTFQAEVGSLMREIEAVKRKEKLVALAERQKRDQESLFEDQATALGRVKELIERRRIQLDERLKAARAFPGGNEYEARARLRLNAPHRD